MLTTRTRIWLVIMYHRWYFQVKLLLVGNFIVFRVRARLQSKHTVICYQLQGVLCCHLSVLKGLVSVFSFASKLPRSHNSNCYLLMMKEIDNLIMATCKGLAEWGKLTTYTKAVVSWLSRWSHTYQQELYPKDKTVCCGLAVCFLAVAFAAILRW